MALLCDYCGDVAEAVERIDVAFGHNQEIALKGATAREWFQYCEGECADAVKAMLDNLRLFAMHGEGSGLMWQLAEQPSAPPAKKVKPAREPQAEPAVTIPPTELPREEEVDGLTDFLREHAEKAAVATREERRGQGKPLSEIINHAGTLSYLRKANLLTVEEAAELTEAELYAIYGVGTKVVRALNAELATEGRRLEPGPDRAEFGERLSESAGDLSHEKITARIASTLGIPRKVLARHWGNGKWEEKVKPPRALTDLGRTIKYALEGHYMPPPILLNLIAEVVGSTRDDLLSPAVG